MKDAYKNVAELLEEAKRREEEEKKKGKSEKRGLEFMGVRFNVAEKQIELAVSKKITPAENVLLRIIELGTIGAQNEKFQICSKTEFFLADLSKRLGYKEVDKIWTLLKSLEKKKYIIRKKTRAKGLEIIGLNPEVFGQILIDSQHEIEKKRHLKMVVDNSANDVDIFEKEPMERMSPTDAPSVDNIRSIGGLPTERLQNDSQVHDIIDEKKPLDSFRHLDFFRREKTFNNSQEKGNGEMSPEALEKRIALLKEQARMLNLKQGGA